MLLVAPLCAASLLAPALHAEPPPLDPVVESQPAAVDVAATDDTATGDTAVDDAATDEAAARSASIDEPFRCPGTNVAFFEEIREAKWVGFEETWDFNTCGEGYAIYGEGATKAWPAFRSQRKRPRMVLSVRPSGKPLDVEFYATVLPWVAFGTIFVVIALAWLLSLVTRRSRITVVDVTCPKCAAEIPVPLNDPDAKCLFCPACGGASVIVQLDAGGKPFPEVTIL